MGGNWSYVRVRLGGDSLIIVQNIKNSENRYLITNRVILINGLHLYVCMKIIDTREQILYGSTLINPFPRPHPRAGMPLYNTRSKGLDMRQSLSLSFLIPEPPKNYPPAVRYVRYTRLRLACG